MEYCLTSLGKGNRHVERSWYLVGHSGIVWDWSFYCPFHGSGSWFVRTFKEVDPDRRYEILEEGKGNGYGKSRKEGMAFSSFGEKRIHEVIRGTLDACSTVPSGTVAKRAVGIHGVDGRRAEVGVGLLDEKGRKRK